VEKTTTIARMIGIGSYTTQYLEKIIKPLRGNTYVNGKHKYGFTGNFVHITLPTFNYRNNKRVDITIERSLEIESIRATRIDDVYTVKLEDGSTFTISLASTGEPIINGLLYHDVKKEIR